MRNLMRIVVGASVLLGATAMSIGPALADPPKGVTPKETDVVSVGSDTDEFLLDQLAFDYNKAHTTGRKLYSWDALNPKTEAMGDPIKVKAGCATIPRPDGSSAGITALDANAKTTLLDFVEPLWTSGTSSSVA